MNLENLEKWYHASNGTNIGSFKQVSPVILDDYRLFTMYQVNMDIDHSPPATTVNGRGGGVFFVCITFIVLGLTMLIHLYVIFTNVDSLRKERILYILPSLTKAVVA